MTSRGWVFQRCALICVALVFGVVEVARANVLDDIGDFFLGNAPEVASSQACTSYAKGMVNFAEAARSNKCPLTGPRYGTDEKAHYFWCMSVTPETSREEDFAQQRQVQACMDLSTQSYCGTYGTQAAKDAHDNKLYHCGFAGPRWGEGSEGHRAYCISEKIAESARGEVTNWPGPENTARRDGIDRCKGRYSEKKKQFCNLYATQSVESANKFKEMKCIGSQNEWGRWYSDYDTHFSWCIGLSGPRGGIAHTNAVNAETMKHSDALNACIARNELITRGKEAPTNKLYSGPNRRSLEEFAKGSPSNPPSKPAPKGNSGPGTGGAYLSKPVDGNSAMDRLGGGGGASGGSSSGVSTSRPSPRPSGGGSSSGISTSKPISPPSGGSSSGVYLSKPISPPSGGSSSGVYLSKPVSPPSGGSSSGVYLSKPGR